MTWADGLAEMLLALFESVKERFYMFLRPRLRTREISAPVAMAELTPVQLAREEFEATAKRVQDKHKQIKDKEALFKQLLAEAPQDALIFDAMQQDLAKKKSVLQNLGGLI
jgi:hypothetical protein